MNHHTRWLKATSLLGAQGWRDRDLSCWQSWGISQVRVCQGGCEPCAYFLAELSEFGRALNLGTLKPLSHSAPCVFLFQATGWLRGPELPNDFQYGTQRRHHSLRVRPVEEHAAWLCCCFCTRAWAGDPSAHFRLSVDSVFIWELRTLRSHFLQIFKPLPFESFLLGLDVWRWHSPRCCQMIIPPYFLRL